MRQAAAGLLRLHPLRFTGSALSRSDRELARSLGVCEGDRGRLACAIGDVLTRERAALRSAIGRLERMRDDAARGLMFEHAAALREQARGLRWITEPQKLGLMEAADADFAGAARGAGVVLSLRGGRLAQRHFLPVAELEPASERGDGAWPELARANAELMARLWAADAVGPLGWRGAR